MSRISTTSAVFLTALAQNYIHINNQGISAQAGNSRITISNSSASNTQQYKSSFQHQQTAIDLNKNNLSIPHIISITTAGATQLIGKITVNGVVVHNISNNQASVNLSPYLSRRTNYVEISGNYQPARNSVRLEFSGPGTKVTQETGGNGILRQTLIIAVN